MIVSFDLAIRMKEVGRNHKTHFAYCVDGKKKQTKKGIQFERKKINQGRKQIPVYRVEKLGVNEGENWISMVNAPTVDEIMEILPDRIEEGLLTMHLTIQKISRTEEYYIASYRSKEDLSDIYFSAPTMADAVGGLRVKINGLAL